MKKGSSLVKSASNGHITAKCPSFSSRNIRKCNSLSLKENESHESEFKDISDDVSNNLVILIKKSRYTPIPDQIDNKSISLKNERVSYIDQSSKRQMIMERNREEIISRYQMETEIDEEIFSKTEYPHLDAFGFMIKESSSEQNIHKFIGDDKSKSAWRDIALNWDEYMLTKYNKIRKKIYQGIHESHRGNVWKHMLKIQEQIDSEPGLYSTLKSVARVESISFDLIDKDVERTFRTHISFNKRFGIKQRQLFNVLLTYSSYDIKIRYTQGMNQVVALLLMYMNEEEAFFGLKTIMQDEIHNLAQFYCDGFPRLLVFQDHLQKAVNKLLPSLAAHFEAVDFTIHSVSTKWFLLCFLNSLPFHIALRIWDIFILEGSAILFPISFTVLKFHKKKLQKLSMEELASFFTHGTIKHNYNANIFFQKFKKYTDLLKKFDFYPIPGITTLEIEDQRLKELEEIKKHESAPSQGKVSKDSSQQIIPIKATKSSFISNLKSLAMPSFNRKNKQRAGTFSIARISEKLEFDPKTTPPPSPKVTWTAFQEECVNRILSSASKNSLNFQKIDPITISSLFNSIYSSSPAL